MKKKLTKSNPLIQNGTDNDVVTFFEYVAGIEAWQCPNGVWQPVVVLFSTEEDHDRGLVSCVPLFQWFPTWKDALHQGILAVNVLGATLISDDDGFDVHYWRDEGDTLPATKVRLDSSELQDDDDIDVKSMTMQ